MKYIIDEALVDELCLCHLEDGDTEGRQLLRSLAPLEVKPFPRMLTFEEVMHIANNFGEMDTMKDQMSFARAIMEAMLK